MNNSLPRLIDGMIATLRNEVIPHVDGEFARGQAYGLIYMLNSLRLRADWSPAFVGEQLAAQRELAMMLQDLGVEASLLPEAGSADGIDMRALEACRDDNDRRVCALLDWIDDQRSTLAPQRAAAIDEALRRYMQRQLKWELSTSAKPMFAEISSGSE
ncbi:MAG: hypothetical protein M0P39_07195 [Rhodocyclaceae bacterium]|jgi:hypothetical protein|nr:hypothetical protein [Rhodocyclaceae bacterium]